MFEASLVKLKRAGKFIGELRSALDQYLVRVPFEGVITATKDGPTVEIKWDGIGLEPGAVIGDCVHNLRTALDLMASQLARSNGHSDKGVYFPFGDSEDGLSDALRRKKFDRCGDDAVKLLVSLAPYRGGNEMLRGLHDLDIQDKHSALILAHQTFEWRIEGEFTVPEVGSIHVPAKLDVSNHVFHFPPDGPLAGRPIIQTLEELVQLVEGILKSFESLVMVRPTNGVTP